MINNIPKLIKIQFDFDTGNISENPSTVGCKLGCKLG